jgi:hypothetical protein
LGRLSLAIRSISAATVAGGRIVHPEDQCGSVWLCIRTHLYVFPQPLSHAARAWYGSIILRSTAEHFEHEQGAARSDALPLDLIKGRPHH